MGNDVNLDGLTIEIESSAGSSSTGIDNLTASLDKLFTSVSKNLPGLNRIANVLKNVQSSSKAFKSFKIDTPNIGKLSFGKTNELFSTDKTNSDLNTTINKLEQVSSLKNSVNKLPLDIVPDRTLDKIKNLQVYMKKSGNFSLQKISMGGVVSDGKKAKKSLDDVNKSAKKASISFDKLINGFRQGFSIASNIGRHFGNTLGGIGKKITFGLIPTNKGLVKSFRQTALALMGVRGLFTAVRKAVSEYMNYDDSLSESLRNNWAIIGSVVAPAIEKLVSLVATLTTYIAALIKTFFGVDIVARANEKVLNGTGKGAKKASKGVKELNDELGNLADFDKLHTIDFPTDKDSSGSSGIEPLKLADVDTSWIDELKATLDVDDWFGLGVAVATKLEEGLRSINWENIQSKLIEITDNFTAFLNGFTYKIDGKLIGENLAQVFNTAFMVVNEFFANYDWSVLGDKLHEGLKGMIETIDWQGLGTFLSNGMKAAIDVFYETFDPQLFDNVGEKLSTSVNSWFKNIDWNKAGQTVSRGVLSILKSIQGFIRNLNTNDIVNAINDFLDGIEWVEIATNISDTLIAAFNELSDILDGIDQDKLSQDISDFLANIDWLNIFGALLEVVGKLALLSFKIYWSSQKGIFTSLFKSIFNEDVGNAIIEGLKEGITGGFDIIFSVFNGLLNGVLKIFGIETEGSPATFFKDMGESAGEGLYNGLRDLWGKVREIFDNFKSKVGEKFGEVTDKIKDKFNIDKIKEHAQEVLDGIKDVFKKIPDWFRDKFGEAWNKVKSVFSSGGEMFEGIKEGVSNAFTEVANKLREGLNWVIAKPFEGVNWVLNKIKDISIFDFKPFNGLWGYNPIQVPQIPALATGTNKIISEGIYHLHEGESVVPKKYNPAVNSGVYDKANEKLISKMDTMIKVMKSLEFTNVVKIGEDDIYKKQTSYDERKRTIYGTS